MSPDVIDLETLCIKEGEAVWYLEVHIVCLELDGPPLDIALCAAVAALEDVRLESSPQFDIVSKAWRAADTPTEPLRINFISRPMSLSFGVIEVGTSTGGGAASGLGVVVLADPTAAEMSVGCVVTLTRMDKCWRVVSLGVLPSSGGICQLTLSHIAKKCILIREADLDELRGQIFI
eukprot:GHVR01192237.1.p1 GENE.GHVR01192237.1~~GHVR01192237.1.p1  ORF type:complete len:177 (+),score=43.46 GHVR01192237.1:237-767(+)